MLHMFDGEDMAMQIRDPLLSFLGEFQIFYRVTNVRRDDMPVKARIGVGKIGGALVAKFFGLACLHEFMVESIEFQEMIWVSKLSDQIRGKMEKGSTNVETVKSLFDLLRSRLDKRIREGMKKQVIENIVTSRQATPTPHRSNPSGL